MSAQRGLPRRITRAIAIACALAVSLAGCTGIPRSGAVSASRVESSPRDIDVILLPDGPIPGSTQEDLLGGFLRAAASPQNDYAVARQFLSQGFARKWDPNASTTVDTGNRFIERASDLSLQLRTTPAAQVDATGEYRESDSSAPLSLGYEFAFEGGEWRISSAPNGIILERFRFDQVFSSHALYFYDPTFTYLIPDLRWFPRLAATGTRIVRALLVGPAPWLQGAVVSAIPEGTGTTAVVVQAGQANVDLTANVLNLPPLSQRRMADQLRSSLVSLPGVSNAQVTVNQSPVTIPQNIGPVPVIDPLVDARALVMKDRVFGYASANQISPIPEISERVQALTPSAVTYSAAQRTAAVRTASGISVVRVGAETALLDIRPGLVPPALDARGYLWSVPASAPDQVIVFGGDGAGSLVATNWEGATGIASLEVSRDGTRLLALLSVGPTARLVVAGIIRDQNGVPQRVGAPVPLTTGAGTGVGATWVDQDEVASVTGSPSGGSVMLQQIGGRSELLGSFSPVSSIAGGNAMDGLRVRDVTGQVQQPRGNGWQVVELGISLLARQY